MTTKSEPLPSSGQPVGLPVADPSPAPRPGPVTLTGRFGTVERLDAARHGPTLWQAMRGHDGLWTYNAFGPFAEGGEFFSWLAERAKLADPYYFTIVDTVGRAIGMTTLMEIRPAMRSIEIGHICYTPSLQRTPLVDRGPLSAGALHVRDARLPALSSGSATCSTSRPIVPRCACGFTFEGVFRQHMIVKGRNRDTAWFSMLDSEWPARKVAFERWLAPDNFDKDGRQRTSLAALNGA